MTAERPPDEHLKNSVRAPSQRTRNTHHRARRRGIHSAVGYLSNSRADGHVDVPRRDLRRHLKLAQLPFTQEDDVARIRRHAILGALQGAESSNQLFQH